MPVQKAVANTKIRPEIAQRMALFQKELDELRKDIEELKELRNWQCGKPMSLKKIILK